MEDKLLTGLKTINKSSFTGSHKLWILHHLLIPKVQWALLIYEVPISSASVLEKKISVYIRKWLNIHPSTTSLSLYSPISPCTLPIKSLTDILRSSKISGHLLLRDSKDPIVSSTKLNLKAGRWQPEISTTIAEAEINFQKIRGHISISKSGLRYVKSSPIPTKQTHSYRKLVADVSKTINHKKIFKRHLSCAYNVTGCLGRIMFRTIYHGGMF